MKLVGEEERQFWGKVFNTSMALPTIWKSVGGLTPDIGDVLQFAALGSRKNNADLQLFCNPVAQPGEFLIRPEFGVP